MRRFAWLALFAVAVVQVQGRADEPAAPVAMPEFAVLERITPVDPMAERETRWANPRVGLTDLVYATLPGYRPLRLDLYREAGVDAPRPLVVVVHGGGWAHANPRVGAGFKDFPSVLAYLAQRGYVVASIEYRLSGEAPFPAQVEDLQAALGFLRSGAARFGIDPDRVALWGLSAGAQIAALHATRCRPADCVQALVGWFGTVRPRDAYVARVPVEARCKPTCAARPRAARPPISQRAVRSIMSTAVIHRHCWCMGSTTRKSCRRSRVAWPRRCWRRTWTRRSCMVPGVGHGLIGKDAATTSRALRQALARPRLPGSAAAAAARSVTDAHRRAAGASGRPTARATARRRGSSRIGSSAGSTLM